MTAFGTFLAAALVLLGAGVRLKLALLPRWTPSDRRLVTAVPARATTVLEAISGSALPWPGRCDGTTVGPRSMLGSRLVLFSARVTATAKGAMRTLLKSVRPASW